MKTSNHGFTVLAVLDGSAAAETALAPARAVAAQLAAGLEVLYTSAEEIPEREARGRMGITESREELGVHMWGGDPVEGILQWSAHPEIALIVLTTHGGRVEGRRRLAGTATRVIARAARPLLLVPPEAQRRGSLAQPVRRVLLPVDGLPATTRALGPVMELVRQLQATIDLLFVATPNLPPSDEPGSIGPPRYVDQPQHEWPSWRRQVTHWFRCQCANAPEEQAIRVFLLGRLDSAQVPDAITEFAEEQHEDAIVLVRRSRLEVGRAPVLRAVLAKAPCPAFVVPGPIRARRSPPRGASSPAAGAVA